MRVPSDEKPPLNHDVTSNPAEVTAPPTLYVTTAIPLYNDIEGMKESSHRDQIAPSPHIRDTCKRHSLKPSLGGSNAYRLAYVSKFHWFGYI